MQHLSYSNRASYVSNALAKQLLLLMEAKQTNLAVSADVTSSQALLKLADTLGPDICVFKTHIDTIEDFTPELTTSLLHLAKKHQFLIFEDRKFADIGHTVKQQFAGGIYRIADWADIINAHALPGPGLIQGLAEIGLPKNKGLLLVAEMSSANHLMNRAYQQQTLVLAQQFSSYVFGFITQHALSPHPGWINMTPGVKLESGGDSLGQQYITPAQAILENGADIVIVGRGIIQSSFPQEEAKRYRKAAWDAYQKRL